MARRCTASERIGRTRPRRSGRTWGDRRPGRASVSRTSTSSSGRRSRLVLEIGGGVSAVGPGRGPGRCVVGGKRVDVIQRRMARISQHFGARRTADRARQRRRCGRLWCRGPASGDARVLAVRYDSGGAPCRKSIEMMQEAAIMSFVVCGSRTGGWVLHGRARRDPHKTPHIFQERRAPLRERPRGERARVHLQVLRCGMHDGSVGLHRLGSDRAHLQAAPDDRQEEYADSFRRWGRARTFSSPLCMSQALRGWAATETKREAAVLK